MKVIIQPSAVSGEISAPASKSAMQRICAAALLNHGITIVRNPGKSNDDLASLAVVQSLGAKISWIGADLIINSKGVNPISDALNFGESGLGLRMFAPIAALSDNPITLKGEGTLNSRPMDFFDEIFPQLGIQITSNHGRLPIKIQGPLQPRPIKIDGSLSSQFLTGILFAFASGCKNRVRIKVENLVSKPYIDLTLEILQLFDYDIVNNDYQQFIVNPVTGKHKERSLSVEGDWSGAAFLLVLAAISGNILVKDLRMDSTQADKSILIALQRARAEYKEEKNGISMVRGDLNAFEFDATDCPDLFPPLVALASFCDGISVIRGVSRLKHKESDRAVALKSEFGKMGINLVIEDDLMRVFGTKEITGSTVHSHHDHRIAMACAIVALGANGSTTILEADAIDKSYPDFYKDLLKLKVNLVFED